MRAVDLTIADGSLMVPVCPSGCGKTTLLGSEAFVHFTLAAEPVVTDDTRELASDTGTEMLQKL